MSGGISTERCRPLPATQSPMESIERRVAGEVKAMTRKEVIVKTIAGELTWIQAADILGITARHLRRLKQRWERRGYDGLVDYRGGKPRRTRIALATIEQECTLQRQRYPDFSVPHFWEQLGPVHGLEISYTWTRSCPCRRPGSWPRVRGPGPIPPAAGAPPAVRDDGTPRCLAPRLAAAAADAGLGGGYGRCRRADPVRALCARGEHGLDVGRTQTPPAHVWALCGALHRSRQSLLLHAQGGDGPHHRAWRGRQPGAEGAGDPPAAGLVPASARAQRARLRDQSRAA